MRIQVLDQGYVELVETYGSDESIVAAARQSTQKGFRQWEPYRECSACLTWGHDRAEAEDTGCEHAWVEKKRGDEGLLRYLAREGHSTPFEFAGAVFEVSAPIFVLREWMRHRSASYSEASARYAPLPSKDYMPSFERLMTGKQNKANKQGSGELLSENGAVKAAELIRAAYESSEACYRELLEMGVARELARVVMPVGRYSQMRTVANLRNWAHFLDLRLGAGAQTEIKEYAKAVEQILRKSFPRSLPLLLQANSQQEAANNPK
jgi:thymidylate synthase (FAD)